MNFNEFGIDPAILRALKEIGYVKPTPIQEKAIPLVLAGRDLLGCAQTGTGKTAAFSIPLLQHMGKPAPGEPRPIRGLILTPTRELALQIYENICQYSRYTGRVAAVIYGGVSQVPQVEALERGADILVATPGRLWDLMGQKLLDISKVECFVLDEADRQIASQAANPVVFGNHAAGDCRFGQDHVASSGTGVDHPGCNAGRSHRTGRLLCGKGRKA